MIAFLIAFATETARILYEGSLYILMGFVIAGLLQEFLPGGTIARHLGSRESALVLRAALLGRALPLCSCGVLPAAAGLRRQGASRSATVSFLISTPETGVDSIALTYGLLGPVMAIVRPVVAVITAIVAGMVSIGIRDDEPQTERSRTSSREWTTIATRARPASEKPLCPPAQPGGPGRVRRVLHYAFVTLLDDIAFWMVIGIVLSGVLSALLPDDFFTRVIGWDSGLLPMLAMAVVGVPLYLCASASTPVAAALLAKGLSPGAALVFLLTGPASSAASIAVVGQDARAARLRVPRFDRGSEHRGGVAARRFRRRRVRRTMLAASEAPDSPSFAAVKIAAAFVPRARREHGAHALPRRTARSGAQVRGSARRRALTWRDLTRARLSRWCSR